MVEDYLEAFGFTELVVTDPTLSDFVASAQVNSRQDWFRWSDDGEVAESIEVCLLESDVRLDPHDFDTHTELSPGARAMLDGVLFNVWDVVLRRNDYSLWPEYALVWDLCFVLPRADSVGPGFVVFSKKRPLYVLKNKIEDRYYDNPSPVSTLHPLMRAMAPGVVFEAHDNNEQVASV